MRELKVSLERARFDSVKRRAANVNQIANITINNTVSFNVTTDLNQNGTIDVEETREIDFAGNGVNFVGNNLNYPIIIRFDHHGFERQPTVSEQKFPRISQFAKIARFQR